VTPKTATSMAIQEDQIEREDTTRSEQMMEKVKKRQRTDEVKRKGVKEVERVPGKRRLKEKIPKGR